MAWSVTKASPRSCARERTKVIVDAANLPNYWKQRSHPDVALKSSKVMKDYKMVGVPGVLNYED